MKPPRFHRRDQRRGGSGFPLHVANRARERQRQTEAKVESADPGAEGDGVGGT